MLFYLRWWSWANKSSFLCCICIRIRSLFWWHFPCISSHRNKVWWVVFIMMSFNDFYIILKFINANHHTFYWLKWLQRYLCELWEITSFLKQLCCKFGWSRQHFVNPIEKTFIRTKPIINLTNDSIYITVIIFK